MLCRAGTASLFIKLKHGPPHAGTTKKEKKRKYKEKVSVVIAIINATLTAPIEIMGYIAGHIGIISGWILLNTISPYLTRLRTINTRFWRATMVTILCI